MMRRFADVRCLRKVGSFACVNCLCGVGGFTGVPSIFILQGDFHFRFACSVSFCLFVFFLFSFT